MAVEYKEVIVGFVLIFDEQQWQITQIVSELDPDFLPFVTSQLD